MEESQIAPYKKRLKVNYLNLLRLNCKTNASQCILELPLDLWREIVKYFSPYDIVHALDVCKLWRRNVGQVILRWTSPKLTPSMRFLCSHFPNLEYLNCTASCKDNFSYFYNTKSLRHLELIYTSSFHKNDTVSCLTELTSLETLTTNYPFSSQTFHLLSSLQKLHTLTFQDTSLFEVPR
jgi:hypothetical protein